MIIIHYKFFENITTNNLIIIIYIVKYVTPLYKNVFIYRRDMSQNKLLSEICGYIMGKSQFIFYKLMFSDFAVTRLLEIFYMILSQTRLLHNFIAQLYGLISKFSTNLFLNFVKI